MVGVSMCCRVCSRVILWISCILVVERLMLEGSRFMLGMLLGIMILSRFMSRCISRL